VYAAIKFLLMNVGIVSKSRLFAHPYVHTEFDAFAGSFAHVQRVFIDAPVREDVRPHERHACLGFDLSLGNSKTGSKLASMQL
jgi:hypothetical protein